MANSFQRVPLEMDHPKPPPVSVAAPNPAPASSNGGPIDPDALRERIVDALRTCFDPEIPVNIHELGLIYEIDVDTVGAVRIRMTLTSPACPVAGSLPPEVEAKVRAVPGVSDAKVEVVWDPPWTQDRMSEAARLQLGLF